MKTLMLNAKAFNKIKDDEILDFFDDNGAPPDGNGNLPSDVVDGAEAEKIIALGLGEFVNASFLSDEEVAQALSIPDILGLAQEYGDWDAFQSAVADRVWLWAHYGAYGGMDSSWTIVQKRPEHD